MIDREFSAEIERGLLLDNCAAEVRIHVSNYDWDAGSRIIIRYRHHDQEINENYDHVPFKKDRDYVIPIFMKEELENLRDLILKALEIWPLIIVEDKNNNEEEA